MVGEGDATYPAVKAKAARTEDGAIAVGLVNADPNGAQTISLPAGDAGEAAGHLLTGEAMDAHNTFDAPEMVVPGEVRVQAEDGRFTTELPPHSVMVMTIGE